ncbi:unnamed protein product (plasmid) [Mycetohabitans rhizoxinica HKI 454]|uniref:Uncharacterized protein n=1 Tax=Mycetohabitans rhizoxinica (strain DSM 19002 / CIP 109453 / HKI 454) TaxID=882378 RepID=E5AV08_MYCRK|nr:unnamed protein product [Mycetohabitans rhizoxinica HKI 454]
MFSNAAIKLFQLIYPMDENILGRVERQTMDRSCCRC